MWAASLSAITLAIGASYDLSTLHTAKQKAQHTADMLALAAAAQIRDLGAQPANNTEGFVEGTQYLLSDFGIDINPYTRILRDDTGNVISEPYFTVQYDVPEEDTLTISVNGIAQPAFMSVAGIEALPYEAETVASYLKEDLKDPASIFLVLDNSGSMGNIDSGEKRIDQLKTTVNSFMAKMDTITTATQDPILRTALWAYSSANRTGPWTPYANNSCSDYHNTQVTKFISWGYSPSFVASFGWCVEGEYEIITDGDAIFVDTMTLPDWGSIPVSTVDMMRDEGGTYPSAALGHAKDFMELEDAAHMTLRPDAEPHKFVIFMTDGNNSRTSETTLSEQHCDDMRNDGVQVYTIGYGISPGSSAERFLKNCAYDSTSHFVLAANATVLEQAFDDIGEDILEEVIRIRS